MTISGLVPSCFEPTTLKLSILPSTLKEKILSVAKIKQGIVEQTVWVPAYYI